MRAALDDAPVVEDHDRVAVAHGGQPVRNDEVTFKTYGWEGTAKTRFIRYQALAGDEFGGVVFTDEIVVE